MPKLPDLSKLTENLDLEHFVENIKSIINPNNETPTPEKGDQLGKKLEEMSLTCQQIANELQETAKHFNKLNTVINQIFHELHKGDDEKKHKAKKAKHEAEHKHKKEAEKKHKHEAEAKHKHEAEKKHKHEAEENNEDAD